MLKGQKGITLIALVITIVILIIIATITVSITLSQSGLFSRTHTAVNEYKYSEEEEQKSLTNVEHFVNDIIKNQKAE